MLPLYSHGMAEHVLRELEIGRRAAAYEDSEACGWSALMDLSYEQYIRNHEEMEMTEVQEAQETRETSGWVLRVVPKHVCPLPHIDRETFVGSIWRCGGCGQHYMVGKKRNGDETEKAFRKISEEKAASKLATA